MFDMVFDHLYWQWYPLEAKVCGWCPGMQVMMVDEVDELFEEEVADGEELDEYLDSIPQCYEHYDNIL